MKGVDAWAQGTATLIVTSTPLRLDIGPGIPGSGRRGPVMRSVASIDRDDPSGQPRTKELNVMHLRLHKTAGYNVRDIIRLNVPILETVKSPRDQSVLLPEESIRPLGGSTC
ncbi:hypothetical protein FHL15_007883 [Xylaria flabelliformis]|uniref:Uncharacterized protein n=1 Tax=Xylaria flabelliformis TaxID=2512241 RepID=A0A553HTJ9_9PEZI|nr:hypothetical protein FHL15_007883 [Xylaria flabelliformis]